MTIAPTMYPRSLMSVAATLLLSTFAACAAETGQEAPTVAQAVQPFLLLPSAPLMNHVQSDSGGMRICIAGDAVTDANRAGHTRDVRDAISKWLTGITPISNTALVWSLDIEFTCDSPHWSVRFWSAPSTRWPSTPAISGGGNTEVYPAGDNAHVLLHEFGHVFGLADTYDGMGGCKPGQPDSVMCEQSQSTSLMQDDIDGVQEVYCNHYPDDCKW